MSHAVGSTSMFMMIVNTMVAGTLGALIADASGAAPTAVAVIGTVTGLTYLAATLEVARRSFGRPLAEARCPSPPA
jgi:hypothetical protein